MKRPLLAAALALASTVAFAAPLTYKIDANHTDVVASWSHFGFSNPIAHFGKVDGSITYDPANVGASKVEVTIPLSGLNSHVGDFDDHLRSADFFDAEKFPTITFKSTSVKEVAKGKLEVTGDFTLHGVTKKITFPITNAGTGPGMKPGAIVAGFIDGAVTINRNDYGIKTYPGALGDEVAITLNIEAGKVEEPKK